MSACRPRDLGPRGLLRRIRLLCAIGLAACQLDGPTGLASGEHVAQLTATVDRAALMFEVSGGGTLDSVKVGVPGAPYVASRPRNGRFLLLATGSTALPRTLRLRVFTTGTVGAVRVVESATAEGVMTGAEGTQVLLDK